MSLDTGECKQGKYGQNVKKKKQSSLAVKALS